MGIFSRPPRNTRCITFFSSLSRHFEDTFSLITYVPFFFLHISLFITCTRVLGAARRRFGGVGAGRHFRQRGRRGGVRRVQTARRDGQGILYQYHCYLSPLDLTFSLSHTHTHSLSRFTSPLLNFIIHSRFVIFLLP